MSDAANEPHRSESTDRPRRHRPARLRQPLEDAGRPVHVADHRHRRQHRAQRRPADAAAARRAGRPRRPATPRCSGWSTPTASIFAGLLFTAAALGDRFGRKGALQAGLVVFAVGSIVGAVAGGPAMLIVGRAIMGIGAAFVMPSTLSILTNVFPGRERAKAIAIWAGISGSGAALGPLASGLLLEHFWWGSVFLINLPIIAVALVAGWVLVPKSKDSTSSPLDPVGRPALDRRAQRPGLRHHRGPAPRLDERRVDRSGSASLPSCWSPSCCVGVAQPPPDARPAALPQPSLRRLVGRHHARVLRHVRLVLPARPVPPGRDRVLAAGCRRAHAAVLGW